MSERNILPNGTTITLIKFIPQRHEILLGDNEGHLHVFYIDTFPFLLAYIKRWKLDTPISTGLLLPGDRFLIGSSEVAGVCVVSLSESS